MMWLNHLRFTVGVTMLVCLALPAVVILKLIVPDLERPSILDTFVSCVTDLRDEIYYK